MEQEKIHSGQLLILNNAEDDEVLFLNGEPLAQVLEYLHGNEASVSYYISDKEIDYLNVQEKFTASLFGEINADYGIAYSEITGYLWTDEELQVGGHDLLAELKGYDGKYINLITRFKEQCKVCEGKGLYFSFRDKDNNFHLVDCYACDGNKEGSE